MDFKNFDFATARKMMNSDERTESSAVQMRDQGVQQLQTELGGGDPVVPAQVPTNVDTASAALEGGSSNPSAALLSLGDILDPEERMLVEAAVAEDDLGGIGVTPPDYASQLQDISDEVERKYSGGGLENTGEWLTSNLIPFRQGMRTADALGDILNVSPSVLEKYISRGELQDRMFDTLRTMTQEDRTAALGRVMPAIEKYADGNNSDAATILDTVTSIFGTRSQAEASRDAAYGMDALAIGMEVLGAKGTLEAVKGVTRFARSAGKATAEKFTKKAGPETFEAEFVGRTAGGEIPTRALPNPTKRLAHDEYLALPNPIKRLMGPEDVPAGLLRREGVSPLSLMGRVAKAAPRVAEDIAEVASENPSVARQMGTTSDDVIVEYGLPKSRGTAPEEGPELYRQPRPDGLQEEFDSLLRHGYDELALSEEDLAGLVSRADRVEELRNSGFDISKSQIDYDEELGVVTGKYTMGDYGGKPFQTAEEALYAVQSRVGMAKVANIELLQADAFGVLQVVGKDTAGKGRFRVRLTYADNAEDFVTEGNVFRRNGKAKTFLSNSLDSLVVFKKRLADTITSMDLRSGSINRELGDLLKPFDKLSTKDKHTVFKLLEEGSDSKVEFTRRDVAARVGNRPEIIKGYQAVRKMYRLSWKLRNKQFRGHLSRQGYFGLDNAGEAPDIVAHVSNAEFKRMSERNANVMYKGKIVSINEPPASAQLFEYHRPIDAPSGEKITHTLIDNAESRISPLPEEVMNVSDGYMGRHLEMRYVAEKDGVTKGFFTTSAEARAFAAERGFTVRRAKELGGQGADIIEDELNTLADMGMLSHTRRRADPDMMMQGHRESMADPTAILSKLTNQISRGVTLDRPIQAMTNKWRQTYGHLMEEEHFPWNGEMKLKPGLADDLESQKLLDEAQAFATRIRLTAGRHQAVTEGFVRKKTRRMAEGMSEIAENQRKKYETASVNGDVMATMNKFGMFSAKHVSNTLGALADPINTVSKIVGRPMDTLKAVGFIRSIIGNPIKQRLMNSAQALAYKGLVKDKLAWSGQMQYILRRLNMGNLDKAAVKSGLHPKHDLSEQIIKEMEDSGLLASASTHDFLDASAKMDGAFVSRKTAAVGGTVRKVKNKTSKYGFEAGERVNLIGAYVAARQAAVDAGEKVVAKDVAIRARQIAGNMGSFNKADWQPGIIGAMSQFMSFGIRQAQLILPDTRFTSALANPVLTNADKGRMALFTTMLWGAQGWGINTGIRKMLEDTAEQEGIEVVPEVAEVLDKGLLGYAYDNTLEALFNEPGEEVNTQLSENFAPFAPVTGDIKVGVALVQDIFDKEGDRLANVSALTPAGKGAAIAARLIMGQDVDILGDAFGVPIGAAASTMGVLEDVWASVSGKGIDSPEKFAVVGKHIASWAPVFNNAFKGRLMGASGKAFNKWGSPITDVTAGEAWTQALLGVPPTSVQDFYDVSSRYNTQSAFKTPKNKELQQTGRDMASVFHRDYVWLENGEISLKDYQERQNSILDAVKEAYEPDQFKLVQDAFMRQIDTLFEKSNTDASDALIKRIIGIPNQVEQGPKQILEDLKDLPESDFRNHAIEFMEMQTQ